MIKTIAHLADIHIRKLHRIVEYRQVFKKLYKQLKDIKQDRLVEPDEYIFIGDRIEKGGNDYPLAQLLQTQDKPYGYTYETEGPEQTQNILEKLSD